MPITIYDVAKKAGVSVATVSRVLNGKSDVSQKTRQEVLRIIDEMNFKPRTVPNKRNNIGILVPPRTHFFSSYYISDVLSGISDVFFSSSQNLVFLPIGGSTVSESELIRALKEEHAVGAIFLYSMVKHDHILRLAKRRFPHIVIGSSFEEEEINWIDSDNVQGAISGMDHLIRLGHKRIGIICPPLSYSAHLDRLTGYRTALWKHGIEIDERLIVEAEGTKSEDGYYSVMELLNLEEPPTAIFAGNDNIALGIFNHIYELGMKIPDDISIVGFDDYEIVSYLHPPLTTIRQSRYELGKTAGEQLIGMVKGELKRPFHRKLRTMFILRQSTAPPRFVNPLVNPHLAKGETG